MATMTQPGRHETRFNEDQYPLWKRTFTAAQRRKLVDDDLAAGKSVSLVLVVLVGVATLAMLLTVWLTS